uniref:AlNc14C167G7909 protein n=1 Tax=Albugo laibachii Nc14 TaxID=890382 RepID=F0WN76_9STRA|nr:AlNc14C167G7909 [Albugo laibachii Nc14]|eukprot:CCA22765.1 AlNc14C167G7909 [Albugo laibachii Nc14]
MLREGMASHASFLPLKFRVVLGTAAILKSHVEQSNRKQELLMVAIQQSSQSFIQRLIQDAGIKRCSIPLALALSLAGIGLEYQHVERLSALRKIKRTRFMFAKLFCSTIRVLLKLIFTRHRCIPSKMTQNQLVQVSTLRLHRTHQPIACSSHIELTPSAQIVKQDTSSISWSLCRAICAFRGSSFCSFGSKMVKTKVRSIFTEKEANALIRAFKISSVPGPGGTILFSSQFSYCCDPTSHHFVNIGTGSIPTSTQSDLTGGNIEVFVQRVQNGVRYAEVRNPPKTYKISLVICAFNCLLQRVTTLSKLLSVPAGAFICNISVCRSEVYVWGPTGNNFQDR